jgi:hypothetical protein
MTIYNRQTEKPEGRITRRAVGAVAVNRFVKINGAQGSVLGERVIGVSYDSALTGELIGVTTAGSALVMCGAVALGQGAEVSTDANGKAVQSRGGYFAAGVVMNAALPGELVEILLGGTKHVATAVTSTTTTSSSSTTSTTTTTTTAP